MKTVTQFFEAMRHRFMKPIFKLFACLSLVMVLQSCDRPKENVVLRQIKDVVVDANDDPRLKASAIFFNPNAERGKLKHIKVDIFVNGKKVGVVDQHLHIKIPAKGEFTIPFEVKLAMKELGFMDTLFGMLGGKKFKVRYEGFLKVTYHGFPLKVPVNYEDEIRVRF